MKGKGVTKRVSDMFVAFVAKHQNKMLSETIDYLNEKIEFNVATLHTGEATDTSNSESKPNINTVLLRSLSRLQRQYDQVFNRSLDMNVMSPSDTQKITSCYNLAVNESERLAIVADSVVDEEQQLAIENKWDEKGLALKRPTNSSVLSSAKRSRLSVITLE